MRKKIFESIQQCINKFEKSDKMSDIQENTNYKNEPKEKPNRPKL